MMAVVILCPSVPDAAVLHFLLSLAGRGVPRKRSLGSVTGIVRTATAEDFSRVVQLLKLCPERPEDRNSLRAVGAYYHFLGFVRSTVALVVPSLKSWADGERAQCSYFAAVALGRRIAFSRDLLAQQMLP
jgi:hypothetical protein